MRAPFDDARMDGEHTGEFVYCSLLAIQRMQELNAERTPVAALRASRLWSCSLVLTDSSGQTQKVSMPPAMAPAMPLARGEARFEFFLVSAAGGAGWVDMG